MATLMKASNEWARRPDDERFTSLTDMLAFTMSLRDASREEIVSTSRLGFRASPDDARGIVLDGVLDGDNVTVSHNAFSQLAVMAGAPAEYLRRLPSRLVADNLNHGLADRASGDFGALITGSALRSATGPRYGRIWNDDICAGLCQRFGDGISGDWRVPGEFGRAVRVTKANTTLFAGDRDMFVFLADEVNRIEVPARRAGKPGSLARGFFVWNSEVGACTFGIGTFLFDYVCSNRIVWGAQEYKQLKIRHTSGAPDRFFAQITPILKEYAESSDRSTVKAIEAARSRVLKGDELDTFLGNRWGKRMVPVLKDTHMEEEARPIESLWDVTTAVTAFARRLPNQDERVLMERSAGDLLTLAA